MPNISLTNLSLNCLEGEVWKDVVGYEGLYMVSNMGRIKNRKGVVMKVSKVKSGYVYITLYNGESFKSHRVHRLVALSHIPNKDNKPQVNHINGIKDDNRLENLEWCTQSENMIHAVKTGLQKPVKGINHPFYGKKGADNQFYREKSPLYGKLGFDSSTGKIVLDTQTGIYYGCAREAAEAKGIGYSHTKNMLNGWKKNKSSLIYV